MPLWSVFSLETQRLVKHRSVPNEMDPLLGYDPTAFVAILGSHDATAYGVTQNGALRLLTDDDHDRARLPVAEHQVRDECLRRLLSVFDARDAAHLDRKRSDDIAELTELLAIGDDLTTDQVTAIAAIRFRNAALTDHDQWSRALRAMVPIPTDFRDDKYWA